VAKDGQQAFGKVEFVYGLSGGLLGQYNASGAAAEEIVWLGDLPVGTIQGGAAYHIAPDHLGAPHQIVNSSNTQVWFWNHDPFGNGAPSAAAGFAHRLRFPGQVYDAETGLHSNGHRDYDPRLGRYVESDPIGLAGGINTYAYAKNNPVNAIDPLGLDPKSNEDDAEALPTIDIAGQQNVVEAGAADTIVRVVVGWIRNGAAAARAGKQARLRELANDNKLGSADRGWIRQEMNSIERGQRSTIRNPPGKDLAHERGREAAKGYDYSHSNLQDRDLHRLQHKYDDFGRANAERPLE
jgi:RHS repeat-associated protein